jgi:RNA polymerase sigma-70 factor, ECF subfamily
MRNSVDEQTAQRFLREVMPLHDHLYRVARRMTRNHTDAEDLLQDTLVRAFASFGAYQDGNLGAWLRTIMTNSAINTYRRKQLRPEVLTGDIAQSAAGLRHAASHHSRSAEMCVLDSMPSDQMLAALGRLPTTGQEVLYYADVEGLRYSDIADLLGVPLGTVMSRIHRARRRLRDVLTKTASTDTSVNLPRVA